MNGNGNGCLFTMKNQPIAQFNSSIPIQLKLKGVDVKEQMVAMLLNSLQQRRVQITDEYRKDIEILVDKYLAIVLASDLT